MQFRFGTLSCSSTRVPTLCVTPWRHRGRQKRQRTSSPVSQATRWPQHVRPGRGTSAHDGGKTSERQRRDRGRPRARALTSISLRQPCMLDTAYRMPRPLPASVSLAVMGASSTLPMVAEFGPEGDARREHAHEEQAQSTSCPQWRQSQLQHHGGAMATNKPGRKRWRNLAGVSSRSVRCRRPPSLTPLAPLTGASTKLQWVSTTCLRRRTMKPRSCACTDSLASVASGTAKQRQPEQRARGGTQSITCNRGGRQRAWVRREASATASITHT